MKQPDRHVLEKIVEEISFLENLLHGLSMTEFLDNETVKRAAAMATINIGELAKHLSIDFSPHSPEASSDMRQKLEMFMHMATTAYILKRSTKHLLKITRV